MFTIRGGPVGLPTGVWHARSHKIQDLWDSVVYQVVKAPKDGGTVYTIALMDELSKVKHVHSSLLKARIQRGSLNQNPNDSPLSGKALPSEDELDECDLLALVPEVPQACLSMPPRLALRDSVLMVESAPQSGLAPSGSVTGVSAASGHLCSGDRSLPPVSVAVSTDLPVPDLAALRRTTRTTAGQHPNIYHLPRAVGDATSEAMSSSEAASSGISVLYRPWC